MKVKELKQKLGNCNDNLDVTIHVIGDKHSEYCNIKANSVILYDDVCSVGNLFEIPTDC